MFNIYLLKQEELLAIQSRNYLHNINFQLQNQFGCDWLFTIAVCTIDLFSSSVWMWESNIWPVRVDYIITSQLHYITLLIQLDSWRYNLKQRRLRFTFVNCQSGIVMTTYYGYPRCLLNSPCAHLIVFVSGLLPISNVFKQLQVFGCRSFPAGCARFCMPMFAYRILRCLWILPVVLPETKCDDSPQADVLTRTHAGIHRPFSHSHSLIYSPISPDNNADEIVSVFS